MVKLLILAMKRTQLIRPKVRCCSLKDVKLKYLVLMKIFILKMFTTKIWSYTMVRLLLLCILRNIEWINFVMISSY